MKDTKQLRGIAVYVDGKRYKSLFTAAIDFEFSYHMFNNAIHANNSPFKYSGHLICLESWLPQSIIFGDEVSKTEINKLTNPESDGQ